MSSSKLVSGVAWNYLGALIKALLQITITAILARLLNPEDFGLLALGLIVVRFGQYFSDLGMGGAIIQREKINNNDISASFTLSILCGLIFSFLLYILAFPLASIFHSEKLVPVLKLLSLGFIFIGLGMTSQALIKRNLDFRFLSLAEILSYIGYGFSGICFAILGFGVYSLVGAYLTQLSIMGLICLLKTRHRIIPPAKWSSYRHLLSFGGRYSAVNFLTFIPANLDHIVIGRYFSADMLGLYNRGKYLVSQPTYNLLISLTKVLFPSYSLNQSNIEKLKELYTKSMLLMGLVILPVSIGMIPAAEQIVQIVLGEKWSGSVIILQLCCIFVPIDLLTSIAATLMSAKDRLNTQICIQIGTIAFMLLSLFVAMILDGTLIGVCIVMILTYWLRFIFYIHFVRKMLNLRVSDMIDIHIPHLLSSGWVFLWIFLAGWLLNGLQPALTLAGQVVAGGMALTAYLFWAPHTLLFSFFQEVIHKYQIPLERSIVLRPLVRRFGDINT